jgi:hypothetical protein
MSSCLGSARSSSLVAPSYLLVVVSRSLRCCLSFVLRRLVFVVLVFLRFPLYLLLVVLLCRRLRCGLQCRRYSLLLRSRARVSLSSLAVRTAILVLPAPTVASLATISLAAGGGIPVYVSSSTLVSRLVLLDLLQLHSLSRTFFGVFAVCSLLQALPRQALLVLCLLLLAPRDHHLLHSQVCPRGIWILELPFI